MGVARALAADAGLDTRAQEAAVGPGIPAFALSLE